MRMRSHWKPLAGLLCLGLATLILPAAAPAGNLTGFYGGINIANMGGDMDDFGDELAAGLEDDPSVGGEWTASKGAQTGLAIGAYYVKQVSPTFGLQFEALYVQRGVKFDLDGRNVVIPGAPENVSAETAFKLSYIEIPMLARLSVGQESSVRPVFIFGPVFALRASADMKVSSMGQSQSISISETTKSVAFGFLAGAGVSFQVGETSSIVLQGRYQAGLTDAFDDQTAEVSAKPGDFALLAGVEFGVGQ